MTYKCKICGGQTTVDTGVGIAICEYCGTKQALTLFNEESERLLYDRGNNYLSHSEYDKAENVFNQLLTIKPGSAELYWNLVLCKYGVTYVKDPATGKYIPTCNRTHYTPIFSDENYKKAIELSLGEKKALFEEDAKTIDNIQKGIISVSKKEKPFDIFISYKETDANGNRTKDSVEAQRLYEKLTEAGYKVFFSRITLEDKIGAEYEPYIYAALYSSKVMITICSSNENIEAVWVKNEWSRFLGFRQHDNSKTLLPLYFDMDKTDLPDDFALLSSYDMRTDGFIDELLRGIKKLIPLPIMKAKRRKQMLKASGITVASLVLAVGIAAAIIIPKELEKQRIQEEAAHAAQLAEKEKAEKAAQEKANEKAYQDAIVLFDNADYEGAEAAFLALGEYKDSAHMAERCPIQPDYDAAMQLYYDGKYAEATWAFADLGDYEDSAEQKEKAELSWRKSLATVICPPGERYDSEGTIFINSAGIVSSEGSSVIVKPNEHGKIVSISNYYILYEDGSVARPRDSEEIIEHDIVQISSDLMLKSDGTVIGFGDEEPLSNIVILASYNLNYMATQISIGVCVDVNGNIYANSYFSFHNDQPEQLLEDITGKFVNVKTINVYYSDVVALTHDGKIISYIDDQISTIDAPDVIDVSIENGIIYALYSNGEFYNLTSQELILSDVVKLSHSHRGSTPITRSGSMSGGSYKTCIHDEWLMRMG